MNKLLWLIVLIGGGMWWQERHGSIANNATRYKIEYAGTIETPIGTDERLPKSPRSHSLTIATKQPQHLSPQHPTIPPIRSTLIAAGIAFGQGSLSIRVVSERIDCKDRPGLGAKTTKQLDRQQAQNARKYAQQTKLRAECSNLTDRSTKRV